MARNEREEYKLMAKPIEATPVLKGQDLVKFAHALKKQDSEKSEKIRKSALSILARITK